MGFTPHYETAMLKLIYLLCLGLSDQGARQESEANLFK